MRGNHPITK